MTPPPSLLPLASSWAVGFMAADSLPVEPRTLLLVCAAVAVVAPLAAAGLSAVGLSRRRPRVLAVGAASVSLAASLLLSAAWSGTDGGAVEFGDRMGGGSLVFIDGITAALLPYVAVVELAILLVAPRRSLEQDAVTRMLLGAAATLAVFCTAHPLALIALWVVTALPTWWSARATPGGRPAARVYAISMVLAIGCMAVGAGMMLRDPPWERASGIVGMTGGWLVAVAVMIRKGIVPFHSWYPALFAGAPMSTALAATMPQVAAYTAVRFLIGHEDHGEGVAVELVTLAHLALVTAVYGAALATVQRTLRGLIGTLAMSQSAVVLAGLSGTLPMELNGAFCVWIASGLALTGIGLVTWALESRAGPLSLDSLQGRFWDAPALAAFFLLFGLGAIGLPGTLSFVADDLIVSGTLDDTLYAGFMMIAATVLSGIAVVRGWFTVFGGAVAPDGPKHSILRRERAALAVLLLTIFALGLYPAPLVESMERAAESLLGSRATHGQLHETPGDR